MMILLLITLLLVGALMGFCLYRFYKNGFVPAKYLQHGKANSIKQDFYAAVENLNKAV